MANRLKMLIQQKADLVAEGRRLLEAAERESRELTDAEAERFDAIQIELDKVNKSIEREEAQSARERKLVADATRNTGGGNDLLVVPAPSRAPSPSPPTRSMDFGSGGTGNPWGSFGEFLSAVVQAGRGDGRIDQRLLTPYGAASGLSEGIASDGGFLVAQEYSAELLKRTYELGAITSRVRRIPIGAQFNGIKINAIDETSRAAGSRWGGVRGYWNAEADTKTAAKPKFRQMELTLKKLTGLCYATDEVLQDAAALDSIISQAFPEELNFLVEDSIVNGTGAGMPLGFMNGGCLVTVAKEAGQAAATIVAENIVKMWARLYIRSQQTAVWLVNQDVFPQLYTMGITVGTGGSPIFQPPGGLSASPYSTLLGRPVIPVEYCATLGTVGDIILADLSQYIVADKGGIQSASSIHVRFINDETTFRFVYRVDGQPIWNAALTPFKGTNTVSPFVVLATRA